MSDVTVGSELFLQLNLFQIGESTSIDESIDESVATSYSRKR